MTLGLVALCCIAVRNHTLIVRPLIAVLTESSCSQLSEMEYGSHSGSGGEGSTTKPCRTCVDFKTWFKQQRNITHSDRKTDAEVDKRRRPDCPVDKDELGRATWAFLHTTAANYPDQPSADEKKEMRDFITSFARFYPCPPCAEDLRRDIAVHPPEVDSRSALSKWFCDRHNVVNRKLGKAEFDCRLVDQRWRDGWVDGSCD